MLYTHHHVQFLVKPYQSFNFVTIYNLLFFLQALHHQHQYFHLIFFYLNQL